MANTFRKQILNSLGIDKPTDGAQVIRGRK